VKGATGSQASYLTLFQGDHEKVKKLEELVAREMGFKKIFPISGQTYTRKQDIKILSFLTSFAASSHKFATDLRLLAHLREVEEPSSKTQVGSSAMPHKKNPMLSERVCGLARFLISLNDNPLYTEATQWLERTLDDSSNRRLYFPQAFLTADALLNLLCPITEGLVVHPVIIQRHLDEELPFLATETILMEAVKQGKDRQEIHEKLRFHCLEAARQIREEGKCPDLYPIFAKEVGLPLEKIKALSHADHFIGRSIEQTEEFLSTHIAPLLAQYASLPPPTLAPPL
jgi:adenylosuccinate lyase